MIVRELHDFPGRPDSQPDRHENEREAYPATHWQRGFLVREPHASREGHGEAEPDVDHFVVPVNLLIPSGQQATDSDGRQDAEDDPDGKVLGAQ